jgi:2-haloacid dehalogenase
MPNALLFDLTDTLLDPSPLEAHFERWFGMAHARQEWAGLILHLAFVCTITESYRPMTQINQAALEMLATRYGLSLSDKEKFTLREAITRLPPHPDVLPSLRRLKEAGYRLAVLTNSTPQVAEAQLHSAGLRPWFEAVFSAEQAQRLKPAPEPYHMAARELRLPISQVRMITCHAWDVAGALRAGALAGYLARPGQLFDSLAPQPDLRGATLYEVAHRIMEKLG